MNEHMRKYLSLSLSQFLLPEKPERPMGRLFVSGLGQWLGKSLLIQATLGIQTM